MTNPILIERKGAVAHVTLNRPNVGNTIDAAMARALLEATIICDTDPAIRCVVVRGNGRMFCAGGNIHEMHAAGDALPALLKEITTYLHAAVVRLLRMEKPVITAIHGAVAGAGVALSAVGDIALAETSAHFTLGYPRIGLSPDGGATWLLPKLIGLRRTQELILTNRRVSAEEAVSIGLVTRMVADGTLDREVETLSVSFVHAAVGALGRTKLLLLEGADAGLEAQLEAESRSIAAQGATAESRLGLAAFVERQWPNFLTDGGNVDVAFRAPPVSH